jgi:hypothetical protein
VRFRSCCPSPLGLCLAQFPSAIARQAMINLSPHHFGNGRVLRVVEHDRGINLRNSPFSRTCWVMFLAFPLDFQTREILQQAVGLFGSVVTWTDNTRFRSRILLRCCVIFVSRIPISIVISESGTVADGGHSWTVPVLCWIATQMMSFLGMRTPFPPMGTPTQWLISRWMRITRSILKMLGIYKRSNKLILIRAGKSHLPPSCPK